MTSVNLLTSQLAEIKLSKGCGKLFKVQAD